MVLNQGENVYRNIKFDERCLMEECPDAERTNFVDSDDSKSDEGCEDIADLLPSDPFNMEYNIAMPNEPSGMDFNISLPRDPFGMDFNIEVTVAAITGWIEDIGLRAYEDTKNNEDNKIFAELNFVWTSYEQDEEEGDNDVSYDDDDDDDDVDDLICFGSEIYQNEQLKKDYDDAGVGAPADALFFALGYLGIKDLLSIERVCKPLYDAVQNDPLLWRNILIEYPLSNVITDDDLLRLTNRAQGKLCSLSLVKCNKITNAGLRNVLESNPGLTKLSVPGCIKLKVETILQDLKTFNSISHPGIKCLRIGELFGLTNQLFKEFKLLLGAEEENNKKPTNYKPRYYRAEQLHLSLEDERAIDIDTCPKCQLARQVYDCPADTCQLNNSTKTCRGCIFCIGRCVRCGCCLDNRPYEETFCFESLCFECISVLLNDCQENGHACFRQMASYHVFVIS